MGCEESYTQVVKRSFNYVVLLREISERSVTKVFANVNTFGRTSSFWNLL